MRLPIIRFVSVANPFRSLAACASISPRLRRLYAWAKFLPGIGPIARGAATRLLPHGSRVWLQPSAGLARGLWLNVDPRYDPDYVSGTSESAIQVVLSKCLNEGHTFYDVGAHAGFLSLIAARLVGKTGAVFAFEPDPVNATRIEQQTLRNGLGQITVFPVAVWSTCGVVHFQHNSDFSGRYSGFVTEECPGRRTCEVEAVTLDVFAQTHAAPTLVKIDVEGGEAEVLRGATRLFADAHPVVICEIHKRETAPSVETFFVGQGYKVRWLPSEFGERHILAEPLSRATQESTPEDLQHHMAGLANSRA